MDRFIPNPTLEAVLSRQGGHLLGVAAAAEDARRHAEAFARAAGAPWMPRRGTGSADVVVLDVGAGGVRIVNTDHGGHLQEWGSRNNPPHAPLRRGVRAAGLRLDEQ